MTDEERKALEIEKHLKGICHRVATESAEELKDLSWQEKIIGLLNMVLEESRVT